MSDLPFGLYERLITGELKSRLLRFDPNHTLVVTEKVDDAEAAATLARHLETAVARALGELPEEKRLAAVNEIIRSLGDEFRTAAEVADPAEELRSIQPLTLGLAETK